VEKASEVTDTLTPEDALLIEAVLMKYATAIDTKQWALLGGVFTPDIRGFYSLTWESDWGELVGLDEYTSAMAYNHQMLDASQHRISNIRVTLHDGDHATVDSYNNAVLIKRHEPAGEVFQEYGSYHDEMVRTPDGWRISNRRYTSMWNTGNREILAHDWRQHPSG
jgi:hypothetical protein